MKQREACVGLTGLIRARVLRGDIVHRVSTSDHFRLGLVAWAR
jgi:hypothetical protein